MNNERIEEIREFLNQPDDVYEEAPAIALELLEAVDELDAKNCRLRYALGEQYNYWTILSQHHPHLVSIQRDKAQAALAWSK